jgi:hypothetical protein
MAKAKTSEPSKSEIFRRYFEKRPELLKVPGFDDIAAMYTQEFSDRDFTENDRQIAANIKSKMRKDRNISRRRRRRRVGVTGTAEATPVVARGGRGFSVLHVLEEQIDDCLIAARRLNRAELGDVIKHLRRARNLVIMRAGEPA